MFLYWSIDGAHLLDGTIVLYGLFIFGHVKRLIQERPYKIGFYHLIPFLGHVSMALYLNSVPQDEFLELYQNGWIGTYFIGHQTGMVLFNAFYIGLSIWEINRFYSRIQVEINYRVLRKYLTTLLSISTGFILFWVVAFLGFYFFDEAISLQVYNVVWVLMFSSTYVVGYFHLVHSDMFKDRRPNNSRLEMRNRLTPNEVSEVSRKIERLIESKLYLDPDLTLQSFAKQAEVTSNDLSWVLNQVKKRNFYQFINHFRIAEFVDRLKNKDYQKFTMLALSMEVGFKSKSTFNKAFKEEMGQTPREFLKNSEAHMAKD